MTVRPGETLRRMARFQGRISRFVGITSHLAVAGLLRRPYISWNLRAAWRQSDRGWQHALGIWDIPDDELDAWLNAVDEL